MTRQDLRKRLNELGLGLDYMEAEVEGKIMTQLVITSTLHTKVLSISFGEKTELRICGMETFNAIETEKKKKLFKILSEVI